MYGWPYPAQLDLPRPRPPAVPHLATVAVPPYDLPLALRAVRERSFLDRYHNTIQVMIQYN